MNVLNLQLLTSRKLLASFPALSPTESVYNGRSNAYLNMGTLNPDLPIILATMLCAFICVFNLMWFLILRCPRRYISQRGAGSSYEFTIHLPNTGLRKLVLKALPIAVHTSASRPPGLPTDCPICLAEFEDGERVRVLPNCNHGFHLECIDKCLAYHSSCPICRHRLSRVDKKPEGSTISQGTESNNATHIVAETRLSTQVIPPRTETLARTQREDAQVLI